MPLDLPTTSVKSLAPRSYKTEQDFVQMQDLLIEARSSTDDWRYAHLGDLIFGFFMVSCHLNPRENIRLWYDKKQLAGYAILGEDPSFECQVLPEYERHGIETEAMTWANIRLAQLRKRDTKRWGGKFVSGVRQGNRIRIAFLEQNGFRLGEYVEVNMLRWLDEPIPEPVAPAGYQIRTVAETGETANRAAAQRVVWHPWTVGNITDNDYATFMQLPGYDRDLDVVAVMPDGVIAAYVNGWMDTVNRIGDFGPVGALPAYRRQGLTRAVLLECMRRMKTSGMNRVCVSTGESNTPAIRLYESIGFKIVNRYLEYVKTE